MKPAFICEYCLNKVGTEEVIKQHELECEHNPNRDKTLYPTEKELLEIRRKCPYAEWRVGYIRPGCKLRESKEFRHECEVCEPTVHCPECYETIN